MKMKNKLLTFMFVMLVVGVIVQFFFDSEKLGYLVVQPDVRKMEKIDKERSFIDFSVGRSNTHGMEKETRYEQEYSAFVEEVKESINTDLLKENITNRMMNADTPEKLWDVKKLIDTFFLDQGIERDVKLALVNDLVRSAEANPKAFAAVLNAISPYKPFELTDSLLEWAQYHSNPDVQLAALNVLSDGYDQEYLALLNRPEILQRAEEVYDVLEAYDYSQYQAENEQLYWHFSSVEKVKENLSERLYQQSGSKEKMADIETLTQVLKLRKRSDQVELLNMVDQNFENYDIYTQNKIMVSLMTLRDDNSKLLANDSVRVINRILN